MSRPKIRFNSFLDDEFWDEVKLGDVARVIMGQSPSASSYNDNGSGLPLIQGNADIQSGRTFHTKYTSSPTKICKKGDVILTVRAPVGEMAFASKRCCLGRGVCAITERGNDSNLSFLFYAINAHKEQWKKLEQGSTFTAVNSNDVNNFKIAMPGLKEQQKVASFFSTLDEKISLSKRKLEALEQLKKGLMGEVFSRRISFKSKDGEEFDDWEKKKLSDVCQYAKGIHQLVRGTYIGNDNLIANFKGVSPVCVDNVKGTRFSVGDVLFGNIRPYLQKAWLADVDGVCSPDVLVFQAKNINNHFLYRVITSDAFLGHVAKGYKGSKMPRGDKQQMLTFEMGIPCPEEQQKIVDFFDTLDEKISLVEQKLQILRVLKRGFMQQMFV